MNWVVVAARHRDRTVSYPTAPLSRSRRSGSLTLGDLDQDLCRPLALLTRHVEAGDDADRARAEGDAPLRHQLIGDGHSQSIFPFRSPLMDAVPQTCMRRA